MSQSQGPSLQPFERVDLSEWQVEVLRLTAFPSRQTEVQFGGWWESVFRGPPDVRTSEPQKDKHKEEGAFGEGKLTLQLSPGRIDWLLRRTERDLGGPSVLGSLPEVLDEFCELMSRWFAVQEFPALQRLAFGAILLYPVPDHQTGYRQLQPYLHNVTLDPASSDFHYQINRRRDSDRVSGLSINRLSKWSVLRSTPMGLRIGPETVERVFEAEYFACRLELDINTVPDLSRELDRELLQPIFGDLVDLGQEIVREGDIL